MPNKICNVETSTLNHPKHYTGALNDTKIISLGFRTINAIDFVESSDNNVSDSLKDRVLTRFFS